MFKTQHQAVVQHGLGPVMLILTSRCKWMLTFFFLQFTNRMLFFAFADSFLIRTCLGILFCLSSRALKLHRHPHLSNVLFTLSFQVILQWFCFLLPYSAITVSNSSVPLCFLPLMRSEGNFPACLWFSCCAGCVFELLSGCRFLMDRVCMAHCASRGPWLCLCRRCRGASITLCFHLSSCCRNHFIMLISESVQSTSGHSYIFL